MTFWQKLLAWLKPKPKPPSPPVTPPVDPPVVPPVNEYRPVAIIAKANATVKLDGAVQVPGGSAPEGVTNQDGYYCWTHVPTSLGPSHTWVTCAGYQDYNAHVELSQGDSATNHDIWVGGGGTKSTDINLPALTPIYVEPPLPASRPGRTSIQNGAFVDGLGAYNPIGESFFWAVWGHKFDYQRMVENATFLAKGCIDYVRIFAQVAGGPWGDRETNPNWSDYPEHLAGTIDKLYELGLRTEVTILAGAGAAGAETPSIREALVREVVDICNARKEKIQFIEISNESVGLDVEENRKLGRLAASLTDIPVALTSVSQSEPSLYLNMRDVVELAIVHYERDISKADGYDRPTRQPWGYPGEYFPDTSTVPQWAIDNEGIGPYSSVAEDKDALRNITRRVVAWIAAAPASLHHSGPGIYGGGSGGAKSGSPANFWECPNINETFTGFGVLRKLVPLGIASWHKTNSHWTDYPWTMITPVGDGMFEKGYGCVRAYATTNGQTVVCVPFGIKGRVELGEKRPMNWTVYSLLDGHVIQSGTGKLTLNESDGVAQLIVAQFI